MLKNYSIRVKMIIVLVTISLLSMGAVALVNSYVEQNILFGQANASLLGAATQTKIMLDVFIDNQIQLTRITAKVPALANYLTLSPDQRLKNRVNTSNNLNALCGNSQEILILSCALLDKQGHNLIDTYPLGIGADESKADYFQQSLLTGLPYMSPLKYVDNKWVAYFSSPVRDIKGQIIGVLRIRYNALRIEEIIRKNNNLGGKDSYAILLDEHYIILAHGLSPQFASWPLEPLAADLVTQLQETQQLPTTFAPEPDQYSRQFAAALRETSNQNPFLTQPLITTEGDLKLVSGAAVVLKNQPWTVAFVQPNEAFVAPIRTQIQATLFVTALVALIVVGLAVWLAYSIAHPIIALTETIQRIDQGNFEANIVVTSNDEIGHLGIAFNNMTHRLRELITSLQENNHQLEHEIQGRMAVEVELQQANEELGAGNEELRAINEELQAVQEQLAATNQDLLKAKNQAEAASRSKSEFLSNMSHELRTPLNGILGYTQILQRNRELTPLQKDGLNIIQQSGEHLLTLITDILDLSKVEAGKLELYPTKLNLSEFLEGVAGIIRIRAQQKGLGFALEDIQPLPQGVLADGKRLRQVLINLLNNAVKFTDKGSVALYVKSRQYEVKNKASQLTTTYALLRFEVMDTGIGMTEEQLKRIFLPFEQVSDVQRRSDGTGLGLTISRRLTELMGTQLQVESEYGKGSRFWFELELPIIEVGAPETKEQELFITGYKGDAKRILVVDDKLHNRLVFRNILEPFGFIVEEAEDGKAGIDVATQFMPDLILMDMVMPVMTGFEAVQIMRTMPELKHMIIVGATASVFEEERQRVMLAGCDDFLSKPVEMKKLLDILKNHLKIEWVYQAETEAAKAQETAHGVDPSQWLIPPVDAMKILLQLATRGDMPNVRKWANQVESMNNGYKPFAEKVRELAKIYQSEAIATLAKEYLK